MSVRQYNEQIFDKFNFGNYLVNLPEKLTKFLPSLKNVRSLPSCPKMGASILTLQLYRPSNVPI